MRIAVLEFVIAEQSAALAKQIHDRQVGFPHRLAFVFRQAFSEAAVVVDGRGDRQAIFLAGDKVFGSVARGGMNDAASLIEGDVVGEHAGYPAIEEWVLEERAFEFPALKVACPRCSLRSADPWRRR